LSSEDGDGIAKVTDRDPTDESVLRLWAVFGGDSRGHFDVGPNLSERSTISHKGRHSPTSCMKQVAASQKHDGLLAARGIRDVADPRGGSHESHLTVGLAFPAFQDRRAGTATEQERDAGPDSNNSNDSDELGVRHKFGEGDGRNARGCWSFGESRYRQHHNGCQPNPHDNLPLERTAELLYAFDDPITKSAV
jgi:hypothetical protein